MSVKMACALPRKSSTCTSEERVLEQTNCPICLDVYKTPRVLNCLHTFCEPCIQSSILIGQCEGTVLSCPICKTATVFNDVNKPPTEWAKELPVNTALISQLKNMDHDSFYILCDVCKEFSKSSPAKHFCGGCSQYQCESCKLYHSKFSATKLHKVVSVDSMTSDFVTPSTLDKLEYCGEHPSMLLELYCVEDKVFCCYKCAHRYHKFCQKMQEVSEMFPDSTTKTRTVNIDIEMGTVQNRLGNLIHELKTATATVENEAVAIPQEIKDVRDACVKVFDQLVNDVSEACGQLKKHHSTELEDKITTLKSLEAAIITSRSLLHFLKDHGSERQLVIGIQKMEEQLTKYRAKLREAYRSNIPGLRLNICPELDKLLQRDQVLATVTTETKHVTVPIAERLIEMLPLQQIESQKSFDQPWYCGLKCLTDGRLVGVDSGNNLCCLLNDSFDVISSVKLPSQPADLAVIGSHEVVVALHTINKLQGIRVAGSSLQLTMTIPCCRSPRSLSHLRDNEIAVGWNKGITVISLEGKEKIYLEKDMMGNEIAFSIHDRILVDADTLFIYRSCEEDNTVTCLDLNGEVYFKYNTNLKEPAGMTFDGDGNVYVCSYGTNTVHQVSPTGSRIQVIETGLSNPYSICFKPSGDESVILNIPSQQGLKVRFVYP